MECVCRVTIKEIRKMLVSAGAALNEKIDEFSEIDSLFGDGDHGVTMERIGKEIAATATKSSTDSISEMFRDLWQENHECQRRQRRAFVRNAVRWFCRWLWKGSP
jgi:hypothetical protein